jgi:hypothetical protein
MTLADVASGLRLGAQNGWNQLEADWRRQLAAEAEGRVVGTACACVFDSVAWINLVLVDAAWRGQGIGTRLMMHVLAFLDKRNVPSVRLDATPLGQPIYEKLGFVREYQLTRFAGVPGDGLGNPSYNLEKPVRLHSQLTDVISLDRQITATNRDKLWRHLQHEPGVEMGATRSSDGVLAVAAFRPGARAWHIGPCLGETGACRTLLAHICTTLAGKPVYLDVPNDNRAAIDFAYAAELAPQRPLTRMGRGPLVGEDLSRMWASFGPEKG